MCHLPREIGMVVFPLDHTENPPGFRFSTGALCLQYHPSSTMVTRLTQIPTPTEVDFGIL